MSTPRWIERRRTCLAYSAGGHLAELERATRGIVFEDCFHVTYAGGRAPERPGPVHHVLHPRRTVWRTLVNAAQALLILLRHRPRLIISTGADVAVPILVLGKLVGARIVFIETGGSLEPTLAGRLVYPIADLFLVQWSEKLRAFPRATLSRGLLL